MQTHSIDFLSRQMTLSEFLTEIENQSAHQGTHQSVFENLKPQQRCARYLIKILVMEYLSHLCHQIDQKADSRISIANFHLLKTDLGAPYLVYQSSNQKISLNSIQVSISHEKELVWVALAIDQALFVSELSTLTADG